VNKRTKKPRRDVHEPSVAAQRIADRANLLDDSCYVWGDIASTADGEFDALARTIKDVIEYLERLPDAEARILVRLLRDDLAKITPPKNAVEQTEEQPGPGPDPDAREVEAAIGYLTVCMTEDFVIKVLRLRESEIAHDSHADSFDLEKFKGMLRSVGFRWADSYFKAHWLRLIEEAHKRQRELNEFRKREKSRK